MNWNIFQRWRDKRDKRNLEIFRNALSLHFKDVAPQRVIHIGGQPVLFQGETFESSNLDRSDVNIAIAVRLISNAISGLPVKVQRQSVIDGELTWEDDPENEINDLIKTPNPHNNFLELITHACQGLIVMGNAHFGLDIGMTMPTAIWAIPPGHIKLVYEKNTGYPSHYLLDPMKNRIPKKLEEIIHIKQYHMTKPFEGLFPNDPLQDQVNSNRSAIRWNHNFFENGAIPDILFEDANDLLHSQELQNQFLESWAQRHEGVKKAHKTGVLPPGITPRILSPNIKDMAFAEMIRLNREQILGFMQIPPAEAGIYEYANYANALIQKRTYWQNCLIPIIRLIQLAFNQQFVWQYWDENYRMIIDYSDVEALQLDEEKHVNSVTKKYTQGLVTLNEGREELGYEAVEGGDDFRQVSTFGIGEGEAGGGMQGMSGFDASHALPGKIFVSSPYDSMRKGREKRLTSYEKKLSGIWGKYFREQQKRIIAAVSDTTAGGLTMASLYFAFRKSENPADIFNLYDENEELSAVIRPFMGDTIENVSRQAMAEAGKDPYFNVDNPWVQEEINRIWNRSKQINEESFQIIKDLLRQAYEDDWSLSHLERAIQDKYTGWYRPGPHKQSRAMTIARTESNAVVSGATNLGYIEAGAKKKWLASIDEATRESHVYLDAADPIEANNFWTTINGVDMRYPGDPNGTAEEVANCRCAIVTVE